MIDRLMEDDRNKSTSQTTAEHTYAERCLNQGNVPNEQDVTPPIDEVIRQAETVISPIIEPIIDEPIDQNGLPNQSNVLQPAPLPDTKTEAQLTQEINEKISALFGFGCTIVETTIKAKCVCGDEIEIKVCNDGIEP